MDGIKAYLKTPEWRKQHRWRKAIFNTMNRLGLTGVHALPINRRWVEIHRRKMPLKGLDPALAGMKIVQVSDLHFSPVVWQRYLVQYVRWINELNPDVVVVTGDLITGGRRSGYRQQCRGPRGLSVPRNGPVLLRANGARKPLAIV